MNKHRGSEWRLPAMDAREIMQMVGAYVKLQGKSKTAKAAGITRQGLDKALKTKNLNLCTLVNICDALGLALTVVEK